MATPSLQSEKDYSRIEQATQERLAMRNAAIEERVRQQQSSASGETKQKKQVRLWAYAGPLMVAGFKDFLDVAVIGMIPGVSAVLAFCCSLLVFFLFLMKDDLTVRPKAVFLFQAGGALVFSTGVEGFASLLNVLPVGLGVIMGIYFREKQYALSGMVPGKSKK